MQVGLMHKVVIVLVLCLCFPLTLPQFAVCRHEMPMNRFRNHHSNMHRIKCHDEELLLCSVGVWRPGAHGLLGPGVSAALSNSDHVVVLLGPQLFEDPKLMVQLVKAAKEGKELASYFIFPDPSVHKPTGGC